MCGIAGFLPLDGSTLTPNKDERAAILRKMNLCLGHRGPDGDGFLINDSVYLGMRRLAIIDLSTGSQPIFNEDKTVGVVFNGEIYNYLELREELINKGHTFVTHSDTEVLVHLYEEEGESFPARLRGMFAFAIWDAKKEELLLGRDHFGVKPLYWGRFGDNLIFASEIKALLPFPAFEQKVNPAAIDDFLTHLFIPSPQTAYHNLFRLEPGSTLAINKRGEIRQSRFWSAADALLGAIPYRLKKIQDIEERLFNKISECARLVLRSDVPLGVFLSGGIDSTMLAYFASQHQSGLKSFTIYYPQSSYSERKEAALVAKALGTSHTEIPLVLPKESLPELIWKVLSVFDEPFGDLSALPTYLLCQAARQHIKVALSGDGGDELFGGYPTVMATNYFRAYRFLPSLARKHVLPALVSKLPTSFERVTLDYKLKRYVMGTKGIDDPMAANFVWRGAFYWNERKKVYSDSFMARVRDAEPYDQARRNMAIDGKLPFKDRAMFGDLKVYLPDQYLIKADMLSMAHSLELRPALLDRELAELAFQLPPNVKIRNGVTKWILRRMMKDKLPEEIVKMPKKGFTPPLSFWLAQSKFQDFVRDAVRSPEFRAMNVFKNSAVEKILEEHKQRKTDHTRRLWAILSLASFFRNNKRAVWKE